MQSEEENINVRAAIVHMVGDMIQSLGVIAAALIIYFKPDWTIADPICTFLFSILVMFTTVPIFKDCMRILMENAPEDIDTVELFNALLQVSSEIQLNQTNELICLSFLFQLDCVKEVHDFHLWAISDEKPIFTAHIVYTGNSNHALFIITELLQKEYSIFQSTI